MKKDCRKRDCYMRGIRIDTDLEKCIACGSDLTSDDIPGLGSLQDLLKSLGLG